MLLIKPLVLFTSIVAAIPTTTTTTTTTVSAPSAAQVSALKTALNNFNTGVTGLNSALTAFTSATSQNQLFAIYSAGNYWSSVTKDLTTATQALPSGILLSSTDSAAITQLVTQTLAPNLVNAFQTAVAKKTLFATGGYKSQVRDYLLSQGGSMTILSQFLVPHYQNSDLSSIQSAGTSIYNAVLKAVTTYSS